MENERSETSRRRTALGRLYAGWPHLVTAAFLARAAEATACVPVDALERICTRLIGSWDETGPPQPATIRKQWNAARPPGAGDPLNEAAIRERLARGEQRRALAAGSPIASITSASSAADACGSARSIAAIAKDIVPDTPTTER